MVVIIDSDTERKDKSPKLGELERVWGPFNIIKRMHETMIICIHLWNKPGTQSLSGNFLFDFFQSRG